MDLKRNIGEKYKLSAIDTTNGSNDVDDCGENSTSRATNETRESDRAKKPKNIVDYGENSKSSSPTNETCVTAKKPKIMNDNGEDGTTSSLTNETFEPEDSNNDEDILLGETRSEENNIPEVQAPKLNNLDDSERELRYQNLLQLLNKSSKLTDIFESRLMMCKKQIIKEELEKTEQTQNGPRNNVLQCVNDDKTSEEKYLDLFQQPKLFQGKLKTHQIEGFLWIRTLYENGLNGILADDMGLGKTIQSIAFFCFLIEMGITGPFLVIAPLSTIPNWLTEFKKFSPELHALLYHGNIKERCEIRSQFYKMHKINNKDCYPIIVTTYEVIRFDIKYLKTFNWKFILIDEGHKLKNIDAKISQDMRQFNCKNKLILTGTPIQNNMTELWSLLNLLMPLLFNKLEDFNSWLNIDNFFGTNDEIVDLANKNEILNTLLKILKPFILRREKKETDLNLPPKKEIVIYAPISETQKELYEATLNMQFDVLTRKKKEADNIINGIIPKRSCVQQIVKYTYNNAIRTEPIKQEAANKDMAISLVMTSPYSQLKKIANHPYLVHMPLIPGEKKILVDENIVKVSGKFQVLDAMLAKLKPRGHKVLLFSTMVQSLDLVEEFLLLRDHMYTRIDGAMKIQQRVDAIHIFNTDPNCFIMLISTRAGGLGLNLTSADTVIIFDSDWNPQCDLQAQDRCHRMGQEKPVVVYRLCTKNTCDERILEFGSAKRKLGKLIVGNGVFGNNKKLTITGIEEMMNLLKSSEYNRKIKSNGYIFTDEELDSLLDRSDMVNSLSQKNTTLQQQDGVNQLQAAEYFKVLSNS